MVFITTALLTRSPFSHAHKTIAAFLFAELLKPERILRLSINRCVVLLLLHAGKLASSFKTMRRCFEKYDEPNDQT